MNQDELNEKVKEIKSNLKWFDDFVDTSGLFNENNEIRVNKRQATAVNELLELLSSLSWTLSLSNTKEINYENDVPLYRSGITGQKTGTPVKVRSIKEEHGDKTYFGIYLGDFARTIGHSVSLKTPEKLNAYFSRHNPLIFVPELGELVWGSASYWGKIESEEELDKLITDDTIDNVWYVKLLKDLENKEESE